MEQKSLFAKLRIIFPRRERRFFVVLMVLILIQTLFDFLGVSLILPFVNLLIRPDNLARQGWYRLFVSLTPDVDQSSRMLILVVAIIVVYAVKNLFAIYMTVVQKTFLIRNQMETSARLLDCYLRKPYTFHLAHNTAEIVRDINTDVSSAYALVSNLISIVTSALISLLLIAYLILVDLWLTLSIVAGLVVYSAVYYLVVRRRLKQIGQVTRGLRMSMLKTVQQSVGGIKEVKLMGRERFFVEEYRADAKDFVKNYRRHAILSGVPRHLVEFLCIGGVLGLVAVKIATHADLSAVVGSLSAFAVASIRLLPSANTINASINAVSYYTPGLDAVCQTVSESRETEASAPPERRPVSNRARADITVDGLRFTYPGAEKPVLSGVSLTVRAGTSVGVVGATGAGKTTLVDLILGLLEPQSGAIRFGGADIRDDIPAWQSRIGYIPQNIYLVDESIRANVALGVKDAEIDEAQVWRALESAQLADFVRGLKDGLDTVIGERGVRLSGGQRQRIGIARALYYDPDILFLDEATSALDTETERAVMESVRSLSGEKTCIIVAHRLTTIEHCDEVYEVRDGTVRRQRPE
ncbi:MAG: ABC transporter ATP-binding protein/permease [Oscillospiraceae bacterium]|nr:ABC transporter ATP-binding protein/permease [Oscillospiraceae bacterium]